MSKQPANPYYATTGDLRPADEAIQAQPRGFRWRIIPTAFLFLLGIPVFLIGILGFGIAIYELSKGPMPMRFMLMFLGAGMYLCSGLLLILAGRATWRARYRGALVYSTIAVMIPSIIILIVGE